MHHSTTVQIPLLREVNIIFSFGSSNNPITIIPLSISNFYPTHKANHVNSTIKTLVTSTSRDFHPTTLAARETTSLPPRCCDPCNSVLSVFSMTPSRGSDSRPPSPPTQTSCSMRSSEPADSSCRSAPSPPAPSSSRTSESTSAALSPSSTQPPAARRSCRINSGQPPRRRTLAAYCNPNSCCSSS